MPKAFRILLIVVGALLALTVFVVGVREAKVRFVTTFDACSRAGYPVQESFPARCTTPDGRVFTQNTTNVNTPVCSNRCGDGICQEVVCLALGCPCSESATSCPKDCAATGTGTLRGTVTIGPNCPVARENVSCPPSPEAYTSREVAVTNASGTVVAKTHFATDGTYHFTLSPGTYSLNVTSTGAGYSKELPQSVVITAGQETTVDFSLDTGIR